MLVGEVAGTAGLAAPLAFVVAAAIAALTGHGYARLAGALPEAGGELVWVDRAFAVPALTAVTSRGVALTGVVSAATIARGFAGYAGVLVPAPDALWITAFVVLLAAVAIRGIRESAWFAALLTLGSVAALAWIVVARAPVLLEFPRLLGATPGLAPAAWMPVLAASFVAFYAFIGFEDLVNLAEETRRPERDMAIAIAAALLYALVTAVAVLAVPPEELARQDAPLAHVMGRGEDDPRIAAAGLVSVTNSALAQVVMAARILLGLARRGLAPRTLGRVGGRGTPWAGTLAVAAVVLGLALTQELGVLARATSAVILVVFAAVNVSVLVLRRRPDSGVRGPLWVPLTALASILALLLASLASGS